MFRNYSVGTKLILLVLTNLIILFILIVGISLWKSSAGLKNAYLSQLTSLRTAKTGEIESMASSLENLLISIAQSGEIKNAFIELNSSFQLLESEVKGDELSSKLKYYYSNSYINKIDFNTPGANTIQDTASYIPQTTNGKIAQDLFILDNPNPIGEKNKLNSIHGNNTSYNIAHAKYHPTYNKFLEKFGLYDIFFISNDGEIFYTVYKEMDFATNLANGAYKNSGLNAVYKKAKSSSSELLFFDDFKPYTPSLNKPAAFIATPIIRNGKHLGVLAFQMPVDTINKIMSLNGAYKAAGLGDSGEVYLIGPDKLMRSDSRFLSEIDDEHVKMLKSTIGIFSIDSSSVRDALAGKNGANIITDYRGIDVLSAFGTINFFGTKWAVIAEIDKDEAMKSTTSMIIIVALSGALITIIMSIITTVFLKKSLIGKLQSITTYILKIVGDVEKGDNQIDLTSLDELGASRDFVCRANDEICKLISSFYLMVEATHQVISSSLENTSAVASGTAELSATSTELAMTFNEQSSQIGSIASAMEEMTNSSREVLERVDSSMEKSTNATKFAENGKDKLQDVTHKIELIKESTTQLDATVSNLAESSDQISNIINVINDIADQTNLLALNAAIEAARAGEAGRGFAVVADEVRKLAERTQTATQQVEQIIRSLQDETKKASEHMDIAKSNVTDGVIVIKETNELFEEIASSVQNVSESNNFIEQAVAEQNKALNEVNDNIQVISSGIEQSSIAINEINHTVVDMEARVEVLNQTVSKFKV